MPKEGPRLGSLKHTTLFFPSLFIPSERPTEVVVFPSPAGVGEIAVTNISFPFFLFFRFFRYSKLIFAICLPIGLNASDVSGTFKFFKISLMGFNLAFLAISISVLILLIYI